MSAMELVDRGIAGDINSRRRAAMLVQNLEAQRRYRDRLSHRLSGPEFRAVNEENDDFEFAIARPAGYFVGSAGRVESGFSEEPQMREIAAPVIQMGQAYNHYRDDKQSTTNLEQQAGSSISEELGFRRDHAVRLTQPTRAQSCYQMPQEDISRPAQVEQVSNTIGPRHFQEMMKDPGHQEEPEISQELRGFIDSPTHIQRRAMAVSPAQMPSNVCTFMEL